LQQVATPEDLYAKPANTFVAHFLGSPGMNLMRGMLVESGNGSRAGGASEGMGGAAEQRSSMGTLAVAFPGASVELPEEVAAPVRGSDPDVVLGLRPESLHLSNHGPIAASVMLVELLGAETHVICQTDDGTRIIVRQHATAAKPELGEAVHIAVDSDPRSYHLFDAVSGERLGDR